MSTLLDQSFVVAEPAMLDAREAMDFLRRKWKIMASITLLTLSAFLATSFLIRADYTATTEILIDAPKDYPISQDTDLNLERRYDPTYLESQLALLHSASLLQKIIESHDLAADPETGRQPLKWLLAAVEVKRLDVSNVAMVSVTTQDPVKSASLANAIAEEYAQDRIESRLEGARKASAWLNQRASEFRVELSRSETAVENFRAEHNLLTTRDGSLSEQQLAQLSVELVKARADVANNQVRYQQAKELLASGEDIQTIPEMFQSSVISALRSQHATVMRQEADLLSKYGERRPEVMSIKAQRRDLEAQIISEIRRTVGNLKNELDAMVAREAALAEAFGAASAKSEAESQVSVRLRDLERIAAANLELYKTFLSRAKIAEERSSLLDSGVRVIAPAITPEDPSFPNRPLFAAVGMVFGLLLGGAYAVLSELLTSGFMAKRQIEESLAIPVLASLPRMALWSKADAVQTQSVSYLEHRPLSRYSEAVRRLRLAIDAKAGFGNPQRLILVTSAISGEGKTTLALSLACTAVASGERVLLIDADLRLASASTYFGLNGQVGLVDLLTLPMQTTDAIKLHEQSGIHVLPAGAKSLNPPALLASPRMRSVLKKLEKSFDTIIIDSPPVGPVADAPILARLAESVIFVVRWRKTSREAVAEAIRQVGGNAKVAGIALTMVDEPKLPRYGRNASLEGSISQMYYLD